MKGLVFDIEATGLLHNLLYEGGRLHCLMGQEFTYEDNKISKGRCIEFYDEDLPVDGDTWTFMGPLAGIPGYLDLFDCICGHGIIAYDMPAMAHCLGYTDPKPEIIDSLVISRKCWPDRPGGHSVEAWAPRLGLKKREQKEWSVMNNDIRDRCRDDALIEINILIKVFSEVVEGYGKCKT